MDTQEIGRRGEDAAAAYLERCGMTVVERNWRCTSGEADIIALDGTEVVLVEVKTRTTDAKGTAEAAVTPVKQRRIARIAEAYLAHTGAQPCGVRFDVITLRVLSPSRALLRHHKAAFVVEA
ncbi:MAG: YraN family protein [Coriobacteriales bacterium]|nr:YraN family protein [Actinomycetes bacterium]